MGSGSASNRSRSDTLSKIGTNNKNRENGTSIYISISYICMIGRGPLLADSSPIGPYRVAGGGEGGGDINLKIFTKIIGGEYL